MLDGVLAQLLTDAAPGDDSGRLATTVASRAVAPGLDGRSNGANELLAERLHRAITGR